MSEDERLQIESMTNVMVERDSDGDGYCVHVDTDDGEDLGFSFLSDPAAADVLAVAQAIDLLRVIANKRPRVGYPTPR